MQFQKVLIEKIEINNLNPRKKKTVNGLKASIERLGLMNPISVFPLEDKFKIIGGERRFLAMKELGWKEIPCCIFKDEKTRNKMLAENIVRKRLKLLDEAEAVDSLLLDKYGENYLTILNSPEIGEKKKEMIEDLMSFNISVVRASNLAKILFLDPEIKNRIKNEEIGLKEAIELIKIKDLSTQKHIAMGLSSSLPNVKRMAKEELKIQTKQNTSSGYALERVLNNFTYLETSIKYASENFSEVLTEEILPQHQPTIEEISEILKKFKKELKEFEKEFNKTIPKQTESIEVKK